MWHEIGTGAQPHFSHWGGWFHGILQRLPPAPGPPINLVRHCGCSYLVLRNKCLFENDKEIHWRHIACLKFSTVTVYSRCIWWQLLTQLDRTILYWVATWNTIIHPEQTCLCSQPKASVAHFVLPYICLRVIISTVAIACDSGYWWRYSPAKAQNNNNVYQVTSWIGAIHLRVIIGLLATMGTILTG